MLTKSKLKKWALIWYVIWCKKLLANGIKVRVKKKLLFFQRLSSSIYVSSQLFITIYKLLNQSWIGVWGNLWGYSFFYLAFNLPFVLKKCTFNLHFLLYSKLEKNATLPRPMTTCKFFLEFKSIHQYCVVFDGVWVLSIFFWI